MARHRLTPRVSRRRLGASIVAATLAAGCVGATDEQVATPSSQTTSMPTTAATTTNADTETSSAGVSTTTAAADENGAGSETGLDCRVVERLAEGDVQDASLTENSGLAASRHHPDVLWGHNDSGNEAGIFAFDRAGRDLGYFALVDGDGGPVSTIDAEDLAVVGRTLYLADIGDRGRPREEIAIHLIPEPDTLDGAATTVQVERTLSARYPDGPSDAEALIVDPLTGQLLIFSKDTNDGLAPTTIYTLDPSEIADDDRPTELAMTAVLDGVALTMAETGFSFGSLAFPGAITAADVSADGRLVAIRTYGSVWLFDRRPSQSVAQALTGVPCEARPATETQGESVALLTMEAVDGVEMVGVATVGEGNGPPVNVALVELAR